jgi:hypothetical protein
LVGRLPWRIEVPHLHRLVARYREHLLQLLDPVDSNHWSTMLADRNVLATLDLDSPNSVVQTSADEDNRAITLPIETQDRVRHARLHLHLEHLTLLQHLLAHVLHALHELVHSHLSLPSSCSQDSGLHVVPLDGLDSVFETRTALIQVEIIS